ncbi:SPL family radical SAM protein [Paenibacillus cymbidii]|uniref:SPL family radical SAM protein n=1 Tax=Paenibacillus cymbidii TaxID=1639034 RepID=UPI00108066C3|nr:radical SAM protein [Paenibacillus cymbidii]
MKPVESKTILSVNKHPSSWFGVKYSLNLYRGCELQCIYCDSRSERYGIDDFHNVTVKTNALQLLDKELAAKRKRATVGTASMSDPYTHTERKLHLTRSALELIARHRFPVHITTKSNLILRDVDVLEELNRVYASVAFTITTADDELAARIEPYAPSPTDRFKALGVLSALGITTSITMMPILPFLEDDPANVRAIVDKAAAYGVRHIVAAFGMTLRDRQRDYYFRKLDELFPGTREKYERRFGEAYQARANQYAKLAAAFHEACRRHGISTAMPSYESVNAAVQLRLFD